MSSIGNLIPFDRSIALVPVRQLVVQTLLLLLSSCIHSVPLKDVTLKRFLSWERVQVGPDDLLTSADGPELGLVQSSLGLILHRLLMNK